MLDPERISAVIVTRGDVDLQPILATLPYGEIIVWDNSQKSEDQKIYGRYLASETAKYPIVYYQDDDVIFTAHEALMSSYSPGRIIANMPSPWYEICAYDARDQVLVGAGSLAERDLHKQAFRRYLDHWPLDDDFLLYCDCIFGQLAPHTRIDLGYEVLPHAGASSRLCMQPGSRERQTEVIGRAMQLRGERG